MSDASKFDFKSAGNAVPRVYEELLVPRMFVPWGKLLLDEAGVTSGQSVLDIACGPGTVARLAAERVGPTGKVTATDISPPMLEIARGKPLPLKSASIEYIESPAAPLQVQDASHEVTVCQQGLQFFPDKVESLREMARATRPGGRIAVAVWGSLEQCRMWGEIYAVLKDTIPAEIADLMKAPFSLCDPEELTNLGQEAGLKNIEVKTCSLPIVFERGVDQAIRALDATPLAPKIAELSSEEQDAMVEQLQRRLSRFASGDECRSELVANILTSRY